MLKILQLVTVRKKLEHILSQQNLHEDEGYIEFYVRPQEQSPYEGTASLLSSASGGRAARRQLGLHGAAAGDKVLEAAAVRAQPSSRSCLSDAKRMVVWRDFCIEYHLLEWCKHVS